MFDFDYIFGFAALLGILIFIHELGHFLAAKWCGVRVEIFSIGMGKKIFKFKKGETEYALSLIPIGGYVKLTGQDPREEIGPELSQKSFRAKSLWQRSIIVLAGPLFNAILALLIFVMLFVAGNQVVSPVLERVLAHSPASEAGFQSGDRVALIESTDGKKFRPRELPQLLNYVGDNAGNPLRFEILRKGDKTPISIHYTPEEKVAKDFYLQVPKVQGTIVGAERIARGSMLFISKDSLLYREGLRSGFMVERVDLRGGPVTESFEIRRYYELENSWARIAAIARSLPDAQLELHGYQALTEQLEPIIPKEGETIPKASTVISWTANRQPTLSSLPAVGAYSIELLIHGLAEGTPAEKIGLKAGDYLLKLNDKDVLSFDSFRTEIQTLARHGKTMSLTWLRDGSPMSGDVVPEKTMTEDPVTMAQKEQFQIGIRFFPNMVEPHTEILRAEGPIDALVLGWTQTVKMTSTMLRSFYHLFNRDISMKTLGGPLRIGQIAGDSVKMGARAFFSMMAFISLNLFVLNLLPIPVLDGGHLLLFLFEGLTRREPNQKFVEVWSTAGFLALMTLMLVVTRNDLSSMGVFDWFAKKFGSVFG